MKYAASERNKEPILRHLKLLLPKEKAEESCFALEIASGTYVQL